MSTIQCPTCGAVSTIEGRQEISKGRELRRVRVCGGLKAHRFDTYERAQIGTVRKGTGAIEDFDRRKLERGLMTAISKRPVDRSRITAFIDEISADVGPSTAEFRPTRSAAPGVT